MDIKIVIDILFIYACTFDYIESHYGYTYERYYLTHISYYI